MKKLIISLLLVLSYVFAVGQSMPNYWVPTSGTNTYSTNITSFGSSYNNKILFVRFTNANTSTATINVNSIGAAPIRKWDGVTWSALASGDIETDRDYRLSYDNTNGWFRLEAIAPAFGSGPLVMGVATNTDAPIAPIFGSTDGHTLRIASGSIGFGPLNLSDVNATTGSLPATNISFSPTGGISTGNVQNAIAEVDAEKTALVWTENEQTGDYTLDATDVNKTVEMNSSSTQTLTLPSNATEAIPIGHYFVIHQRGSSAFNIAAGSGATAVFPAGVSAVSPGQGLSITAKKISTNGWQVENGSAGGGGGSVNSVSGTTNRITSTGGTDPVIDISATFEALLGKVANPLSQFAATTSAQLRGVLSDESGTGNSYFQGGDLGTPSAGVLTNATGLPVSTGLANATGGTRIIGRASGTSGAFNEIVATSDNTVLNRSGGSLTFSTIGNAHISDLAWSKLTGTPTTIAAAGITDAAPLYVSTNTQTTSYTAALTDAGNYIEMNSASSVNVTIAPNASVSWIANTQLTIVNYGAGVVSIVPGAGVTFRLQTGTSLDIPQYGIAVLKRKTTDEWYVFNGSSSALTMEGTYSPTNTNVTNVAASTIYTTNWYRVGNRVTVFGRIDIDVTTASSTDTEVALNLPVSSNLANDYDLSGSAISDAAASLTARIKGDATNDRASIVFKATSATNDAYSFQFSYQVK